MARNSEHLTHLVYEASLDNSLWPELILELTEQLLLAGSGELVKIDASVNLGDLSEHFRRAFAISEKMAGLQEREAHFAAVLDSFSFGLALIGDDGQVILSNQLMSEHLPKLNDGPYGVLMLAPDNGVTQQMCKWVDCCNRNEESHVLQFPGVDKTNLLMLPRQEAVRMGFPAKAAAVLLSTDMGASDGLCSFSMDHGLTRRESELVGAFFKTGDLRAAALDMGLAYESARTYLKRVFEKTGCSSQVDLISALVRTPMAILRKRPESDEVKYQVRRMIKLRDGRALEYFTLGPEGGDVVVHFDGLAGIAVDVVGHPAECLPHLQRHNIRLITPCRPGGFRSDPKPMKSLCEFAPDVAEMLDQLGVERFSISSVSFGSGSALAVAHELQDRVDKMVLASACYPEYRHPNWREMDQLYQLSNVLGRYWPAMLRQIIPYLVRSIMQNTDRYFDRHCKKATCANDIEVLSHPYTRKRSAKMLAERTALGMDGMVEENLLNARGWDFDVRNISVPVELVHGAMDNVAPLQGAELLAGHLPNAVLHLLEDKGHYHYLCGWPWLLARAAGRDIKNEAETYVLPEI